MRPALDGRLSTPSQVSVVEFRCRGLSGSHPDGPPVRTCSRVRAASSLPPATRNVADDPARVVTREAGARALGRKRFAYRCVQDGCRCDLNRKSCHASAPAASIYWRKRSSSREVELGLSGLRDSGAIAPVICNRL